LPSEFSWKSAAKILTWFTKLYTI